MITGAVALALTALGSACAIAAQTDLGNIGRTELQQNTGDAVTFTCRGFVANGTDTPDEKNLFDTCRSMVQTSNDISGNGPTRDSLGLNADELAAALQQVATEEFAATESMANEISNNRINTLITRLAEVRRGVRGISISGLAPQDGEIFAMDQYPGTYGGAAGDETSDWGRLGLFLNGSYGTGTRDRTDRTDKFDFDTYNINFGLDYGITENIVLGGALSYYDSSSDFAKRATVSGGEVDADGWGGFVYGTYYGDNFYVDGLAGYSSSDYSVVRSIVIPSRTSVQGVNENAIASPDSDDVAWSLGAGYSFNSGNLTYGPYGRLTYTSVDIDGYRETGADRSGLALNVESQTWRSFTSVLGGQIAAATSHSFGVLSPQARFGWVHEFENDAKEINATYVHDPRQNVLRARTDDPDRDYFELGLSLVAVLKGGVQVFFSYDTILGMSELDDHLFTLGGRWELN